MKNLYVCEKCGNTFTYWDEAFRCENSHQEVESLYPFNLDTESLGHAMPLQFWEDGAAVPSVIIMRYAATDQNGDYIHKKMPDGTMDYDWRPVVYKRSVAKELPNGHKLSEYYDAMNRQQLIQHHAADDTNEEKS